MFVTESAGSTTSVIPHTGDGLAIWREPSRLSGAR